MPKIKIDKADEVFSNYIRQRDNWTCQRCGKRYKPPTKALHCSHFFGRGRESTRYDPDNCIALCYGCHSYFDGAGKEDYRNFKINQLGQAGFDALLIKSNTYKKKDRKMSLLIAKELLKGVNNEI